MLSIIVPVYNTSEYLNKCLESIVNQTFEDIEIICINDASTDNSLDILREFQSLDDRIKIIDFENGYKNIKGNQGVSVARNIGIDLANGEFIGFVDSDDYVDIDYFKNALDKFTEKTDFVNNKNIINFQDNEVATKRLTKREKEKVYNLSRICNYYDKIGQVLWNKVYRKSFIKKVFKNENNIFPAELKRREDNYFLYIIQTQAEYVNIYNGSFYYHRIVDNSLTIKTKDEGNSNFQLLLLLYNFFYKHNLLKKYKINFKTYLNNMFFRTPNKNKFYENAKDTLIKMEYLDYKKSKIYSLYEKGIIEAFLNTHNVDECIFKLKKNKKLKTISKILLFFKSFVA